VPDIEIALTADEFRRLQQVALALGTTVEKLAADELRARYALSASAGKVITLRPRLRDEGGKSDGRD